MKFSCGLPRRFSSWRTSRREPTARDPTPPSSAKLVDNSQPHSSDIDTVSKADNAHPKSESSPEQSQPLWSTAYSKAVSQLDANRRSIMDKGQDLGTLLEELSKKNATQKNEPTRKYLAKLLPFFQGTNTISTVALPFAGSNPIASAAVGIVQGVASFAKGVCETEATLDTQIKNMLAQIKLIGKCDTLSENTDKNDAILEVLVDIYDDLCSFYCAAVEILLAKPLIVKVISENFRDRIGPIVTSFLGHARLLDSHLNAATFGIVQSIDSKTMNQAISTLFGSENMSQLTTKHNELTAKMVNDTCEWVTRDPKFCDWYQGSSTLPLVLCGDWGHGKSTTMAFIVNYITKQCEHNIFSPFVCYHYCGQGKAGESLSVYSNYVYQLLEQRDEIKPAFLKWVEEKTGSSNYAPTQDPNLLRTLFFNYIKTLERPTYILLDGLDECNKDHRQELLAGLKHQSEATPWLKICVSIRHNEQRQNHLQGFSELRMQNDPDRDKDITAGKVELRLSNLRGKEQRFVINELSKLAEGNAMWIEKAVDLFATRDITAPKDIEEMLLHELPKLTLPDLYLKLFLQVTKNDEQNAKFLSSALEILAIAGRSLSILELGWAIAFRRYKADFDAVSDFEDCVDTNRLLVFLNPFISHVQSDDENSRQLKLVHSSVTELVFQAAPENWAQVEISTSLSTTYTSMRQSQLHGQLAKDCVLYLSLDEIRKRKLYTDEDENIEALTVMPSADAFKDSPETTVTLPIEEGLHFDPIARGFGGFFTYASCYWLYHLYKTKPGDGPALEDFITLTTPKTIQSDNWWKQFHSPDYVYRSFESPDYLDPLAVMAEYGPDYMFEELLQKINTEGKEDQYAAEQQKQYAVKAIIRRGDISRLPMLICFNAGKSIDKAAQISANVMRLWQQRSRTLTRDDERKFNRVFDHIASGFDIMVQQEWANEILCCAAQQGCLPIIKRLFEAASHNATLMQAILQPRDRQHEETDDAVYHQSVGEAVWNNRHKTVAYLLQQEGIEPHLQYRDKKRRNVLHLASRWDNLEMMKLLLSRFSNGVNQKNIEGDMPLQSCIFHNSPAEQLKLLLEAGADVRCGLDEQPSDWYEPIRMASRRGNLEVIKTLVLFGGADPMSVFVPSQGPDDSLELIDKFDNKTVERQVKETLLALRDKLR